MPLAYAQVLVFSDAPAGDSEAFPCEVGGFAKCNGPAQPNRVLVELAASRLGLLIGAPTVSGAALQRGAERWYVSLKFGSRGENPPPVHAYSFVRAQPAMAWGVVVFDCWIANPDRHTENMAWSKSSGPALFDHDSSLLAADRGDRDAHHLSNHCLAPHFVNSNGLEAWLRRAEGVSDDQLRWVLDAVAEEASASSVAAKDLADLVVYRRQHLRAILRRAYDEGVFRGFEQEELLFAR